MACYEALTSAAMFKKCGIKISFGKQEHHILDPNLDLSYQNRNGIIFLTLVLLFNMLFLGTNILQVHFVSKLS